MQVLQQDYIKRMPSGGYLLIRSEVLNSIEEFRQSSSRNTEAGGILLGYYRDAHLDIVSATTPGKSDIRKRQEFFRRDDNHHLIAESNWMLSNGLLTYIGEWHTHPQKKPIPSAVDISEWQKGLPKNRTMALLIQGIKYSYIGLFCNNSLGKKLIDLDYF